MRYDHEVLLSLTPLVEDAVKTVQETTASKTGTSVQDLDTALERLAWCQEILERVQKRCTDTSYFSLTYKLVLDQGIAMLVLLESRVEPTQALFAFGFAVRALLFEIGQIALPAELFEDFENLISDNVALLIEFFERSDSEFKGIILARVFVFHLMMVACIEDPSAHLEFELGLEGNFRALFQTRATA